MVDIATFRQLARSFPETSEQPHFEKPSFRVGKKIFATLDLKNEVARNRRISALHKFLSSWYGAE
jgi:hypothetical protein